MQAMTDDTAEYRPLEAKPLEREVEESTENSFTSPSFSESYHAASSEKCHDSSPENDNSRTNNIPSPSQLIDGYLRQFLVLHEYVNGDKINISPVDRALIERDLYDILYIKNAAVYTREDENDCEGILNNLEIRLQQLQTEYKQAPLQEEGKEEGTPTPTVSDYNRHTVLAQLEFREKVEAKVLELLDTDESIIKKEISSLLEAEKPAQKSVAEENTAYAHWVLGNLSKYKEHVAYLNDMPTMNWRKPKRPEEFLEETLDRYKKKRVSLQQKRAEDVFYKEGYSAENQALVKRVEELSLRTYVNNCQEKGIVARAVRNMCLGFATGAAIGAATLY